MANIEIYIWTHCPYCVRAKALLASKGVKFTVHDITGDDAARAKMVERTGGPRSVPQIFIDDEHYGGCDDIHALDRAGKLDALINA